MLDSLPKAASPFRATRVASWHQPLVSVIVTHYNYSDFVEDALLSLLDQTHSNWECLVVDDASDAEHRLRLQAIVDQLNDSRVRILPLEENGGQVPAFFAGLERTRGEFVCLLDPDDRYAESFLEEALAAHLNEYVIAPIVSTDQYLVGEQGLISGGYRSDIKRRKLEPVGNGFRFDSNKQAMWIQFIPGTTPGWHWTSTSSLMFRRAALKYLKPQRKLAYKRCADGYLAQGAHMMGGTLFLPKPLVYRTLHSRNSWITDEIFASSQDKHRPGTDEWGLQARADAREALLLNGAPINLQQLAAPKPKKDKRLLAKWKRSILKRLPFKNRAET